MATGTAHTTPAPEGFDAALAAVDGVEGWMTDAQARRLFEAGARCPPAGGSSRSAPSAGARRSSWALAAPAGVEIVAVDPHGGGDRGPQEITPDALRGEEDYRTFHANLERAGVNGRVRHVRLHVRARRSARWRRPIDLLYVDGAHRYAPARDDIARWGAHVRRAGRCSSTTPSARTASCWPSSACSSPRAVGATSGARARWPSTAARSCPPGDAGAQRGRAGRPGPLLGAQPLIKVAPRGRSPGPGRARPAPGTARQPGCLAAGMATAAAPTQVPTRPRWLAQVRRRPVLAVAGSTRSCRSRCPPRAWPRGGRCRPPTTCGRRRRGTRAGPRASRARLEPRADGLRSTCSSRSCSRRARRLPDIPLWNPYIMGGRPVPGQLAVGRLLAVQRAGLRAAVLWSSLAWMAALKVFLAALGTFLLRPAVGMRFWAALLRGLVFGFSLWSVSWVSWTTMSVWAWLPLGCWPSASCACGGPGRCRSRGWRRSSACSASAATRRRTSRCSCAVAVFWVVRLSSRARCAGGLRCASPRVGRRPGGGHRAGGDAR